MLRGFEAISDKAEFVAIHDGARCLITPEQIEKVVMEAFRKGAATAAAHVSDTVKRADFKSFITETIDRSELWLAQTPQVFKLSVLRRAYEQRFVETFTDDASVVEAAGMQVVAVNGNRENIKLTTPFDMMVAKTLMECWTPQQEI